MTAIVNSKTGEVLCFIADKHEGYPLPEGYEFKDSEELKGEWTVERSEPVPDPEPPPETTPEDEIKAAAADVQSDPERVVTAERLTDLLWLLKKLGKVTDAELEKLSAGDLPGNGA